MSLPSFSLQGQTALVTGASSGLGWHFAHTLAAAGASVVVAARRTERLKVLVNELESRGARALAVEMDVSQAESVRLAFDAAQAWGATPQVLVNNAGIAVSKPFLEQSEEDFDAVLQTNLKGAWLVGQECARRIVAEQLRGSIVNVASIIGERVAGHVAPYAASKSALIQLTRAMALELAACSIRVNALAPGYVVTELNEPFLTSAAGQRLMGRIPQKRFGRPQDLDGALLLLASSAGDFMTGSVIAVDGGHLVSSL